MKDLRWPLALTGRLDVSSLSRPSPDAKINLTNQNIYGMFLSAVEESLSITLGDKCRAIRVAHMTWMIPTHDHYDGDATCGTLPEYSLLTLRSQITAIGSLLLMPEVVATDFKTVSSSGHGTEHVVLAPSGTSASMAEDLSSLSLKGDESDGVKFRRQMRREARARLAQKSREDSWKSAVRTRLGHTTAVPLSLDESTTWTRVCVPSPKPPVENPPRSPWERVKSSSSGHTCLWPTNLCFENANPCNSPQVDTDTDWLKSGTYEDPLTSAEQWLTGKLERDRADLAEREKIKEEVEAKRESVAAVLNNMENMPDHVSLSSPVNIRTQDQISMNGIYPTPPDALPPGIFTDPVIPASIAEDDVLPTVTEYEDPATAEEDYTLARQASHNSQSAPQVEPSRKNSTDDLFDDMDEEMFGAPDVDLTDADFNFFDDTDQPSTSRRRSSNHLPDVQVATQDSSAPDNAAKSAVIEDFPIDTTPAPVLNEEDGPSTVDTAFSGHDREPVGKVDKDSTDGIMTATPLPDLSSRHQDLERIHTPPLSPSQIKQRFLPSPVPASLPSPDDNRTRRGSNFNPVAFKEEVVSFDAKYRNLGRFGAGLRVVPEEAVKPNGLSNGRSHSIIDLPPKRTFQRVNRARQRNASLEYDTSSYESDSSSTGSDVDSEDTAPPSTAGKRKRLLVDDGGSVQSPRTYTDNDSDVDSSVSEDRSAVDFSTVLDLLLSRDSQKDPQRGLQESQHRFGERPTVWKGLGKGSHIIAATEDKLWDIFDFTQEDMISIAQLVAQQSINTESNAHIGQVCDQPESLGVLEPEDVNHSLTATCSVTQSALKHIFTACVDCDFSKLASIVSVHAEHAPISKNQPRPLPTPRRNNVGPAGAQHLFAIQPPCVRLQRAGSPWEMLPSSLKFWEPLSLEPASGPKNVAAYAIYPDMGNLTNAVEDFFDRIGMVYENCKLGSHVRGPTYNGYNDGLVGFPAPEDHSARSMLENMRDASVGFGDLLRDQASLDADRAIVIYMFCSLNDEALIKYLCGCFWALQQAFADGSDADDVPSEFVLQVVPIDRIADPDAIAISEPVWLSSLASQVYDRIPLRETLDPTSAWVIPSAPCVQLVSPLPRRINFALHERPPRSLFDEAQILHVAYAISSDNCWLTAAWSDNTGRYQFNTSFYIKDIDGKEILNEVRDMSLGLARSSTWRILVARVGTMRNWEKEVWKERPSDNWTILLLDIDVTPTLQISATDSTANFPAIPQPGNGFMTPASTPQPGNFGVSPEAHGGQPSTPIEPSEPAPPPDPDSYLIDATDETWGLVLPFSAVHGPYELKRTLASGILLKRGTMDTRTLPSLGVDIIDTLMPKPGEGQPNWLQPRTPDAVLREVLSWYRGLGLLSRIRGLDATGAVPWHIKVAIKGSEALTGFVD